MGLTLERARDCMVPLAGRETNSGNYQDTLLSVIYGVCPTLSEALRVPHPL